MQWIEKAAARCLAAVWLTAIVGGVSAQQLPLHSPVPSPGPSQQSTQPSSQDKAPQRTTATYDDWVVQCTLQTASLRQKACEMAQVTQFQGNNLPFSRVAIGIPVRGRPPKFIVQIPVNASFHTSVRILTNDTDPVLAMPFSHCLPSGCFADFTIDNDALKKLRAAPGAGKILYADALEHEVIVPLSFKGFSQAFDALEKE